MAEGFSKISLPVGGKYEQKYVANRLLSTPDFEAVGTTRKPRKAERLPQKPHTPYPLGEPTALCSRRMKVS